MKVKTILYYSFLMTSFISVAIANEEAVHHEPSFWDLKYPFVNFIILLAILSKVIKPLREKFKKQAEEVKSIMESAARNSKDAEERFSNFHEKVKNIDSELIKISSDYESDAIRFAGVQKDEASATISRMKHDLEKKLEGEKAELIDALNHDLLNKVLQGTQNTIKNNKDYQAKATQNIVLECR